MEKGSALQFPRRSIPPLARVKQTLRDDRIEDVRGDVRSKLLESGFLSGIKPRARIAITAGSRGGAAFVELMRGIVDAVRSSGGDPFIVPSMGSHGGATAEGQVEILSRLGVTEKSVEAPVRASMQTHALGTSDTGAVAHLDELVSDSDGVIVVGRTKAHPENREGVASGLLKMTTVGLGKQVGAQQAHTHGLWASVRAVPRITLEKANVVCGVAVVENAFRYPAMLEIVAPAYEAFLEADERLLRAGESYVAGLPFEQLDLLIVDELGKDVSGTGMDLNIIGKWRMTGGPREPDFRRIVVLSLTEASLGNGLGIGLADFTTERFTKKFDWQTTYVNVLTATEPGEMNTREGQLPLALSSDREAIEAGLFSSLASEDARVCRIQSTAKLDELFISAALVREIEENGDFRIGQPPAELEFDADNNLF
jgi:hypothetical protein